MPRSSAAQYDELEDLPRLRGGRVASEARQVGEYLLRENGITNDFVHFSFFLLIFGLTGTFFEIIIVNEVRESPIGMAPASQAGSGGFDSRLALHLMRTRSCAHFFVAIFISRIGKKDAAVSPLCENV